MTLIGGFARQLKGKLSLSSPPGLTIRLVFTDDNHTFTGTHLDANRQPLGQSRVGAAVAG